MSVCVASSRRIDSAGGANSLARATFDAGVGIDVIDFALGDSTYGALGQTGAASYTDVGNNVSHDKNFNRLIVAFIAAKLQKKSIYNSFLTDFFRINGFINFKARKNM